MTVQSFEQIESFAVDYAPVKITKWRSKRTGLNICYIDQPSPIVNGYFAVGTEVDNDAGSPHTLEHLVFMGSKNYPYKGFLDTLGNRFFSSTNAWTAVDQTVYNITTAGWDGFKTLLPVYLEHILYPTLTDEACLTEVYHIDGKGDERGVVFCEMQGVENQAGFQVGLRMQRLLYDKQSGYSSYAGGLMGGLRHLTNEEIRQFHQQLYRPDNLSVIITGTIDEGELLDIMNKFDSELDPLPSTPTKRPWVDSIEDKPLNKSIIDEFEFPDKDESMGELLISWVGPGIGNVLKYEALDMLGSYFTENANSVFNTNLIEIENPLATEVYHYQESYKNVEFNVSFNGVPTERLLELDTKIKSLINEQADPKNFDLDFMKQIIKQQKLSLIFACEKKSSHFYECAIVDFLYNPIGDEKFRKMIDLPTAYDTLLTWDKNQWCELIKEQLIQNKPATVLGKPSAKLNKRMNSENKRIKKEIKNTYGDEGLKKLDETLEQAKNKNDLVIPDSLLTSFEKADPSKIKFIETKSYKAGSNDLSVGYEREGDFYDKLVDDQEKQEADQKGVENQLFFHFEDFESKFVTIHVIMSTECVSSEYLRYLSIMEEIFNMAIEGEDGTIIPYDKVINALNEDLIEFELDTGFDGAFLELIHIKVKCEQEKYKKAIDWIQKIMTMNVMEKERIKVIIEKIINALPDKKRNGELMLYSKEYRTMFTEKSTRKAQDSMYTEGFYRDLLKKIEDGGFEEVKKELDKFKTQLFRLDNVKVFVNGGCGKLDGAVSSWNEFSKKLKSKSKSMSSTLTKEQTTETSSTLSKLSVSSHEFRSEIGINCCKKAFVVTISSIESSNLTTYTKIPLDYLAEDIFKIALASEYLVAVEGPFWRGVRGNGLAYGSFVNRNVETGYLTYNIYSSSEVEQAWSTSKKIVDEYSDGTLKFEQLHMENSISTIINSIASNESNLFDSSLVKISDNVFRKRGPNYKGYLIEKLKQVTQEDLVMVMNKYFVKMFEKDSSVVFASVPGSKGDDVVKFFEGFGYEVELEEIDEEEGSGGESEEESEESEEEGSESEEGSDLET